MVRRRRRLEEIHLYFGWDDSVLWYGMPIPYAESGLSPELIEDLTRWGASMRTIAKDDMNGVARSESEEQRLQAQVAPLARRVAREIGPDVTVIIDAPRGRNRIHHEGRATNPAAQAAFQRLRERELDWRERVKRAVDDGDGALHWSSSREAEDA